MRHEVLEAIEISYADGTPFLLRAIEARSDTSVLDPELEAQMERLNREQTLVEKGVDKVFRIFEEVKETDSCVTDAAKKELLIEYAHEYIDVSELETARFTKGATVTLRWGEKYELTDADKGVIAYVRKGTRLARAASKIASSTITAADYSYVQATITPTFVTIGEYAIPMHRFLSDPKVATTSMDTAMSSPQRVYQVLRRENGYKA